MNKPFYISDCLLYPYNAVDISTLSDKNPLFYRTVIPVMAHLGVNYEDILSEVQEIEDRIEREDFDPFMDIMTTTITEYPDFVVCLSYKGFVEISKEFEPGYKLRRERYAELAKDLIRIRDKKATTIWHS